MDFNQLFGYLLLCFLLILSGCGDQYDKGYKKGYQGGYHLGYSKGKQDGYNIGYSDGKEDGYTEGENDGYTDGESDGYISGYTDGTVSYIKDYGIPSIGFAIVLFLFIVSIYYIYRYFKDPTKRVIDKTTDTIEEKRKKNIAEKEIVRKKYSIEEQERLKAHILTNKVFEKIIQTVSDEKSLNEIEIFRQQAEEKILEIQLDGISKMAQQYEEFFKNLKSAKHLSAGERAELFSEITEVIKQN